MFPGCLDLNQEYEKNPIENLSFKEMSARRASYLVYLAAEQENENAVMSNISKGLLVSIADGGRIRLFNREGLENWPNTAGACSNRPSIVYHVVDATFGLMQGTFQCLYVPERRPRKNV